MPYGNGEGKDEFSSVVAFRGGGTPDRMAALVSAIKETLLTDGSGVKYGENEGEGTAVVFTAGVPPTESNGVDALGSMGKLFRFCGDCSINCL